MTDNLVEKTFGTESTIPKSEDNYRERDPIYIQNDIEELARKISSNYAVENFYKKTGSSEENEIKGFEKEKQSISYVLEMAKFISSIHQQESIKLPRATLKQLHEELRVLDKLLRDMRNFHEQDLPGRPFQNEQKTIIRNEKNKLIDAFQGSLYKFQNAADHFVGLITKGELSALKEQVNRLTDAQTKQGIEKHHTLFKDNALQHYWAGWFWIFVGTVLAGAAWLYGYDTMMDFEALIKTSGPANNNIHMGLVLTRIFLFGFLATLIFWSFKNYRLNKHNELLNQQKALALQTFTEFSNAASTDNDMRRVVLGKVATTIFDLHNMGYITESNSEVRESDILSSLISILTRKEGA